VIKAEFDRLPGRNLDLKRMHWERNDVINGLILQPEKRLLSRHAFR